MIEKEMTMEELKAAIVEIETIEENMRTHAEAIANFGKRGEYVLLGIYAEAVFKMKNKRFDIAYKAGIHEQLA